MTCNVGRTEKGIRLVMGVVLLALAFWAPLDSGWRVALGAFGGISMITALIRFCPLWKILGISTCRQERR
jgi:hypothetical protein